MEMMTKAFADATKAVDTAARTVRSWVSRETVDRTGDVLVAEGCDLGDYMANPVVLWAHDRYIPPIGRALDGTVAIVPGEGIEAVTQFAETGMAADVFDLYAGGFLKAFSVGFRAVELGQREEGQRGDTITRWKLFEYSAVTVPAHADALVKAAEAGSDLAGRMLQLYYPEDRDAVGAARVALDIKRVVTGLESVRNHARHLAKSGEGFDVKALEPATEFLRELGLAPAAPSETPQPHADASGDLPEEAVAELLSLAKALRAEVERRPSQEAIARQARRDLIGGGYPR